MLTVRRRIVAIAGALALIGLSLAAGVVLGGNQVDDLERDQTRQLDHLCFALDEAGSDSTDQVVLDACRPPD